jgi:bifunctional non-homologous end joining protein LigD
MLRHAAGRPITLVRCPEGTAADCFFQKHGTPGFGAPVGHLDIEEKSGEKADYLYLDDLPGLMACVQMNTIEFHGWASHVETLEKPDRLVFDLDPAEGLGFAGVKKAAEDIRDRLTGQGLQSFALLTGGKGIHVVVPVRPKAGWDAIRDFTKGFAHALVEQEPDRFTATMSKEKRKGKIFVDWLRNQRGSTAIMPWSVRAREGAPIAAPVSWDELAGVKSAQMFSVEDCHKLVERAESERLKGWGKSAQSLPKSR